MFLSPDMRFYNDGSGVHENDNSTHCPKNMHATSSSSLQGTRVIRFAVPDPSGTVHQLQSVRASRLPLKIGSRLMPVLLAAGQLERGAVRRS